MKNKKSLLSLGLFALVLFLGVGYAAVQNRTLTISGAASTVDAGEIEVYFSEVKEVTNKSANVTASGTVDTTDSNKPLVAGITVSGLTAIGDYAEVTYVVSNDETDVAASISEGTITVVADNEEQTNLSDYYAVTTNVKNPPAVVPAFSNVAGTAEVTVRVELVKLPITDDESSANITLELVAAPVQPGN